MKDLEIRGAGNILGAQQSGHIQRIGYDLYFNLLQEELTRVRNLSGGLSGEPLSASLNDFTEQVTATMDIELDANIPTEYVPDEAQKIRLFKRIANVASIKERRELKDELQHIYGKLPHSVDALIIIALLKNLAAKISASKITIRQNKCQIQLSSVNNLKNEALLDALQKFKNTCALKQGNLPIIYFNAKTTQQGIRQVLEFLLEL